MTDSFALVVEQKVKAMSLTKWSVGMIGRVSINEWIAVYHVRESDHNF